ncbi:MAG: DMT family transporter [Pseudomonadota bacterium]
MLVLCVMPLFFSSNIIFGRNVVDDVEPFTLAFLRWSLTFLTLLPFAWKPLKAMRHEIIQLKWRLVAMGFLGMWICGALVYLALKYTTATNGTLIYTSSPVLIIVIEWLFRGRKAGWRESLGIFAAFVGVVIIVVRGTWSNLTDLEFNLGDLIFVGAAIAWAIYSVGLRSPVFSTFGTLPLFTLIAGAGALTLAPFAIVEMVALHHFPNTLFAWQNILGIVVFASLLAFSTFQYGVSHLGASLAGVYMYLLPVYGVTLAVLFLNETLALFHLWGILLVIGGVVVATAPLSLFKRDG